jgi:gliding motility-associated-like protein
LNTAEGCATISDKNGNLLFYTDGISVWDRTHVQMANGFGMNGDPSSAQSAIIVPKPGSSTRYYIFTVPATGNAPGVCYSEVDMALNGGLGDVIAATKNTFLFANSAEKIAAVKHANGIYVWVIAHGITDNTFHAYLVDCNGVGNAVLSNVGQNETWPGWGYLVASSDGHKLAKASRTVGFEILDFDNTTGIVSNPVFLGQGSNCYGISFSPNNNVLYGLDIVSGNIYQWNLLAGNAAAIIASITQVATAIGSGVYKGGAMQLGPDGKLYIPQYGLPWLSAINNPNTLGAGCNFLGSAVNLSGRNAILGLPPFIQSYFDTTAIIAYSNNCLGRQTGFTISGNTAYLDSVRWNFADPSTGAANTSSGLTPTHLFSAPGNYNVMLIRYLKCVADTSYKLVPIAAPANSTQNIVMCPNATFTSPAGHTLTSAGTYIDTIAAANGCDSIVTTNLSIGVTNVDAGNNTGICKGQSTQLNATGGLNYTWSPSGGLSNPNIANPVASPTVTTTYTVTSQVQLGNIISNGDFSQGNTGFSSSYTYKTPPNTTEGQYWVSTNAQAWNGGMASCGDHTSGTGNMLLVNGATTANVSIWCETVSVQPNTTYAFSTWLTTLTANNPAQLQFSINGSLLGSVFVAPTGTCNWQQFYTTWNSGSNTTASICIVNQNTIASGNDFALDDISFAQICNATDSVVVAVYPTYSDTVNASICQGDIYTLPDGTTTTIAGTYIKTLTTTHGCDSVITTNLTVYPTYSYTVSQTICPSDLYKLPDGTFVNTTGTYVTHLQTANGCDSMTTTHLTVVPPAITASNDTAICKGTSVQLNASGGLYSYAWAPSAGLSDSSIANPVATPQHTTSYIVTTQVASGDMIANGDFSNGNVGFSSSYTYTSNLGPEGTYFLGANPHNYHNGFSACADHTTGTGNMMIINGAATANVSVWCETINVLPNTNYAFSCWGQSVSSGNPAELQFSIDGTLIGNVFALPSQVCTWQQFYAIWNSGNNTTANICIVNQNTYAGGNDFALDDISFVGLCNVHDTVTVTVNNPDTVVVDTAVCQGIIYTYPDGTTSTITGTDTAHLFNRFGCDSTVITNLTVHPAFSSDVFDSVCYGQKYTLPSGVAVNTTGVYTDTLFTVHGCDSIIITHLTINPPPVTGVYDTICQGQTYIRPSGIQVSTAGVYVDTLSSNTGCDSVVITNLTINPISATTVLDTICQGAVYTLQNGNTVNTPGSYPVTLTNRFGCDSVVTTVLTVITVTISATETDALCNGSANGSINANAGNGVNPYNYVLSANGNAINSNASGSFSSLQAGNYTISATDAFGCGASASIIINQPAQLQLTSSPVDVTCYEKHDGKADLNAVGGTPAYTYTLAGQYSTTGHYNSLDIGSYTYSVTDAHGCTDTGSLTIHQPDQVTISIIPDSTTITLGQTLQLVASSNYDPGAVYLWSPSEGLSCTACPDPVVAINSTMQYNIAVSVNINGNTCGADKNVTVTVIPDYDLFIPNAFTPNGDGLNDFFQIFGNLQGIKYIDVQVYDRIGEKVFESNNINFKWDGTFLGKPVQPSVLTYTMQVVFVDNHSDKIFKGSITLLR